MDAPKTRPDGKHINQDNIMGLSSRIAQSFAGSSVLLGFAFALCIGFVMPHLESLKDFYFDYLRLEMDLEMERNKQLPSKDFIDPRITGLQDRLHELEEVAHIPTESAVLLYPLLGEHNEKN